MTFRTRTEWRITTIATILLLSVALATFWSVLSAEFVRWDDLDMVVDNALLRPPQWARLWTRGTLGLYTPLSYSLLATLTMISRAISHSLQPIWFHATNLSLHVIAALAVWRLLRSLIRSRLASLFGALIFLVHPLAVESVAWIASLNTLLATALGLIALNLAIQACRASSRRAGIGWFIASILVFVLALCAKPSVCGLPLALFAIDRLLLRLSWRMTLARAMSWVAASMPFMIVGRMVQPALTVPAPAWPIRPVIALDSIGFYILHWIAPWRLGIDYGRTPQFVGANATTYLHVGVALAVIAIAASQARKRPILMAATLIALAGVAPVLGWVPFDFQYYSTVADRYVYFATLGPALAAAWVFREFEFKPPARLMAGVLILLLAALAWVQARTWHDTYALTRQALGVNPSSVAAFEMLGSLYAQNAADAQRPSAERAANAQRAVGFYTRALRLRPQSGRTQYNLGNLLFNTGNPAEAVKHYAIAAATLGNDVRLQNNWGIACWRLHDPTSAIAHFNRAIQANPSFAETYANKAIVLLRMGQTDSARELCEQSLRLEAGQPQATRILSTLHAAGH